MQEKQCLGRLCRRTSAVIGAAMILCIAALPVGLFASGEGLLVPAETGLGWTDGWVAVWKTSIPDLKIEDTRRQVADNLVRIVRRWTWNGREPLERVVLSIRLHIPGESPTLKPFIPGVLLYGNPSNAGRKDGRVPVFAGEKGEFAIFEEHRIPMPFALLENARNGDFTAVHVLPSPVRGTVRDDLWWSLGVEVAEGGTDIVALSGPIGYNRRRSTAKAQAGSAMTYEDAYITLRPGQIVEKTFWIQTGRATKDAFGFEQAMMVSFDLFKPYYADRHESFERIFRLKRDYAMTRWIEDAKSCGFDMFDPATRRREIVLGWCGCGATCGYALPVLNLNADDWTKAQKSLDFISDAFIGTIRPSDGMFNVNYAMGYGRKSGGDPVSCGQSLYSIVKAIRFAEKSDGRLNPAKWKTFAEKACDAMSSAVLKEDWKEPTSTAAGFLVAPLVVASGIFGKGEYLAAAEKIAAMFERRYFGYDAVYWGGTLDASCEDKEGAMAAFQGYVALLRNALKKKNAEAERRWARLARHAMNMMLSYTVVWDVSCPPGRLSDHAFKSTGWTVVSVQNQCLDAFGVLATPEIWWMGGYLGDERLKKLAEVMYRSCFQLTDEAGSLGEQILQTNYKHMGDMRDVYHFRGGYSEHWTVFWLTAHFLNAAADFSEMRSW